MAIFKSQVLTQASGSVGGMTYTRTRSGLTIRARSMPINPRTTGQQEVRNIVSALSGRWASTLTETQREQWAVYASNVAMKNRLGDTIFLSAMPMYIRCNTPRMQIGNPPKDTAPTSMTVGDPILEGTIFQSVSTPFAVSFDYNDDGLEDEDAVIIYASTARNPSVNFFKGPYRLNAHGTGAASNAPMVPNPTWTEGQKIFVRARIAYADGRLSPSTEYSLVLLHTPV